MLERFLARRSPSAEADGEGGPPPLLKTMCGILAVSGYRDVIQDLYDGLIVLQHRGQDAAGIVTYNSQFHLKKSMGMVNRRCKGAYSAVVLIGGHGIVGFRDPHGIRPLQLGKRRYGMKEEYMIASESTVFKIG